MQTLMAEPGSEVSIGIVFLFSTLVSIGLTLADASLKIEYLDTAYSLAVLVPSIAAGVRRMHDVNKSGWYILIPIYNLILAFTAGTEWAQSIWQ
jgi:uncharacterized membrane protein YhaH (DUF805 family)